MKKSYHSRDVPIRLATMTRRTDEAWAVPSVGGIGISLGTTRGRRSPAQTGPRLRATRGAGPPRGRPGRSALERWPAALGQPGDDRIPGGARGPERVEQ